MMSIGLIATAVGLWRVMPYLSARVASVFVLIAAFAIGVAGFARVTGFTGEFAEKTRKTHR